jgi:hypothetical protein
MERRTDARARRPLACAHFSPPALYLSAGMVVVVSISKAAKAPLNLQGVGQCTKARRIPHSPSRYCAFERYGCCFFFSLDLNRRSSSGKLASRCRVTLYGNFVVCNNMQMRTPSRPTIYYVTFAAVGLWKIIDFGAFLSPQTNKISFLITFELKIFHFYGKLIHVRLLFNENNQNDCAFS